LCVYWIEKLGIVLKVLRLFSDLRRLELLEDVGEVDYRSLGAWVVERGSHYLLACWLRNLGHHEVLALVDEDFSLLVLVARDQLDELLKKLPSDSIVLVWVEKEPEEVDGASLADCDGGNVRLRRLVVALWLSELGESVVELIELREINRSVS
jgi:hypothetical protein